MEGYRKSDALASLSFAIVTFISAYEIDSEISADEQLGQTYFDGLHNDPESVQRLKNKYNFHSANLLLLRLNNC